VFSVENEDFFGQVWNSVRKMQNANFQYKRTFVAWVYVRILITEGNGKIR